MSGLPGKIRTDYEHTIRACYIGYITQAIVNNLAPLLFITFSSEYGLSLDRITLITTVNFLVQLAVDLLSAKLIDRIGYRTSVITAHILAAAGLVMLAVLPELLPDPYIGILASVVVYAIGGGIIEVLISPIVEACPTASKEKAMSLLHSFYCWGHLAVVILSVLFFHFAGISNWHILAVLWAVIPVVNVVYFSFVPIYTPDSGSGEERHTGKLFRNRGFLLFLLLMVCAGASEQAMSQWASAFAESALHIPKSLGDILGPCAFALFMGTSRAIYGKFGDKIPLKKYMTGSCVLCIVCYLTAVFAPFPLLALLGCALCGFSVGIFWPGTFSAAARSIPNGGTAMFAFMALAGDLGCASGPTVVGFTADIAGGELKSGLIAAILFPAVMLAGTAFTSLFGKNRKMEHKL